ncbi:MMPL family transporter [Bacillus spongiae]|uniref:MMPL family transporter n=1 Tax=Bacillus spongiae TaxID=2683610 RepID=A0ABU8HFP5_9BACI
MKKVLNARLLSFITWIAVTVAIVMTMPDLQQLVKEKGQITLPSNVQSQVASYLDQQMEAGAEDTYSIIAVYHNDSKQKFTKEQVSDINATIDQLNNKKAELGITEMVTHLDSKEIAEQLISEDGTTILTQIAVDEKSGEINEVADRLNEVIQLEQENVNTFLTGNSLIIDDFSHSIEEGVKKTEAIAVIFIIGVLILVFRSPIIPVISLLTVGISYLVSMGVVAHLVDLLNFPFSNFTQVFLVVILFGIGTDYNILLYTRFKEELSKSEDIYSAVKNTFKSAGKTVIYSGLAVFIGFAVLFLADFSLYRSMSAVAIGVAVLILVLITLNPFFMALLGKTMFWPSKKFEGHGDSKLWAFLSKQSFIRPFTVLIMLAVLLIPVLIKQNDTLSYNDLLEVDDSYASKQGINIIEKHYSPGFSSPTTVLIQEDKRLDNQKSLQELDELAEKISKIEGVSTVLSPTRPLGEKIKELYLNDQSDILSEGLGEAQSGVDEINAGLSTARDEISASDTNELDKIQAMIDGTGEVKSGVSSLADGVDQLAEGYKQGAIGAKELEDGLAEFKESFSVLFDGYRQFERELGNIRDYLSTIQVDIERSMASYEQIINELETSLNEIVNANPELTEMIDIEGIFADANAEAATIREGLAELPAEYERVKTMIASIEDDANKQLKIVSAGLNEMETGINQLHEGAGELRAGLEEGVSGSEQMSSQTPELEAGLNQIHDGQKQLFTGLQDLEGQMELLQSGLSASTEGLDDIHSGLNDAEGYLNELGASPSSLKFFVPQEILEGEDFQTGLDTYMSADRKIAQMNIVLSVNPYSKEAMSIVSEINHLVESATKGTEFEDAVIGIGGKSAENVDLENLASGDFARTATIMLIGIGLVLVYITKSIFQPIYIIVSMVLAYGASIRITEIISVNVLDMEYLTWNVPFFSFIMIVALGVDYSIFLMMRYVEIDGISRMPIVEAAKHIGGVVISAALILGGTFAALIPSGVLTLIQVATVVMVALAILSFVMLPILLPGLIGMQDKLERKKAQQRGNSTNL